jgi:hypothetical protein
MTPLVGIMLYVSVLAGFSFAYETLAKVLDAYGAASKRSNTK